MDRMLGWSTYSLKWWLRSISHTKGTLSHSELKHYRVGSLYGKGQIVRVTDYWEGDSCDNPAAKGTHSGLKTGTLKRKLSI